MSRNSTFGGSCVRGLQPAPVSKPIMHGRRGIHAADLRNVRIRGKVYLKGKMCSLPDLYLDFLGRGALAPEPTDPLLEHVPHQSERTRLIRRSHLTPEFRCLP